MRQVVALTRYTRGGLEYKGIQMMAAEGVHEEVEALLNSSFPPEKRKNIKVLDLASGQGALVQRIKDMGFGHITAWELDPSNFQPQDVKVESIDLNTDFSTLTDERFDLISATEIIEHLENTYHFIREISKLLKPDGILLLSTPNIDSALSRIQFLFNGRYRWFHEDAYYSWGHIQPISAWQLEKALEAAHMKIIRRSHNSKDVKAVIDGGRTGIIKGILALLITPFIRGAKDGDINLWLIRHANRS